MRPRVKGSLRHGTPAFSLVELMISVGLLGLMMTLAGKVFSISVESTGLATALINVSQSFRLLEESLRVDLRGMNPERSLLVIDAYPINGYWTQQHQEGDAGGDPTDGYPHVGDPEREAVGKGINGDPGPPWKLELPRADVLMFFTSRDATSAIYPSVRSSTVQVVYGHAELGELKSDDTWNVDPLAYEADPALAFWDKNMPFRDRYIAHNWHLARRSVLIIDALEDDLETLLAIDNIDIERKWEWTYSPMEDLDDTPPYLLSDGGLDFITLGNSVAFDYVDLVLEGGAMSIPANEFARWYRRSRLDRTPPAALSNRLAHYFLPGCASFKVEWALSDTALQEESEVVWVDPWDVAGNNPEPSKLLGQLARFIIMEQAKPSPNLQRIARLQELAALFAPGERFYTDTGGQWHQFFARDSDLTSAPDDADPFFPRALRITVDVYDEAGRFERPMRHVMVIPVGNDS